MQEVDQTLIGQTVVKLMESIEQNPPASDDGSALRIVAVGIAVVVDAGESSVIRIECSEEYHHQTVGIFTDALEVARGDVDLE